MLPCSVVWEEMGTIMGTVNGNKHNTGMFRVFTHIHPCEPHGCLMRESVSSAFYR